ncbi:alpha/beta hydrolase family esterase [Tessaracoccus aquimaris]|uniref:extracellular catalytic domain type 1 short-chain-length polyhydroxyalkanoate depolymerase n=1 Tax=Tessaracoccus aquimaris TaxID=1332264 RepID=UPI00098970B6|nr:PHB depolymerase family esterase [Tessaracoccus aquimaris]
MDTLQATRHAARPRLRRAPVFAVIVLVLALLSGCTWADRVGPSTAPPGTTSPSAVPSRATPPTSDDPSSTDAPSSLTLPSGRSDHELTWDGTQRSFRTYRPAQVPQPVQVVVVLHGGGGSAATAEAAYGWDRAADRHGFVVVYPESVGQAWNAGSCCGRAQTVDVDDVGFVGAVVAELLGEQPLDPERVYLTGFSNGAMLSYRIACEAPGVFAAIAPVSGTQLVDCADAKQVSLLAIHGTSDPSVPYGGGPGSGVGNVDGPSAPDVNQFWRTVDDCSEPTDQQSGAITRSTAACPSGRTVELITIDGGAHHWPGSASSQGNPSNSASNELDATEEIWSFFVEHTG